MGVASKKPNNSEAYAGHIGLPRFARGEQRSVSSIVYPVRSGCAGGAPGAEAGSNRNRKKKPLKSKNSGARLRAGRVRARPGSGVRELTTLR